jgi:porin
MGKFGKYFLVLFLFGWSLFSWGQSDSIPRLGSSDQVDNRIDLDGLITHPVFELPFLNGYFAFKDSVKAKTGFTFAIDYTSQAYWTNATQGEKNASSGIARFYGSWELTGRKSGKGNTGAIVYKVEHRHKYGTISPFELGFSTGFVGITSAPFNDSGYRTQNLYWRQRLAKGRISLVAGFLDVTDFFDVYALASPWMHFNNFSFSTGIAAVNVPNDGYLGIGAGGWITNKVYAIAGMGDLNGNVGNVFEGFETFLNSNEYFTNVEIGITSNKKYMLLDNIHMSYWHRDASVNQATPEGWGLVLSATKYINQKYLPFARFAYTKNAGSFMELAASTGIGYQPKPGGHLFGIGMNWSKPNTDTYGSSLINENQFSGEIFSRIQLSSRFAITPNAQLILNPGLSNQDGIFMFSLRARINI